MKKIILSSLLLTSVASAEFVGYENQLSAGGQVGIFGFGLNIKDKITNNVGIRAGFNMLSVKDIEIEQDEVKFDFDLKLQDIMLVADYHPWGGSFRATAGMLYNNSSLDGDIMPAKLEGQTIEVPFKKPTGENYTYDIDELGSIHAIADFDPVAPYIGIGWDTSFAKKRGFGFTFDLGVAFTGSVETDYDLRFGKDLDLDNIPEGKTRDEIEARRNEIKTELEAEIDKEMVKLQDELDQYKIMPYISIGFNYKF